MSDPSTARSLYPLYVSFWDVWETKSWKSFSSASGSIFFRCCTNADDVAVDASHPNCLNNSFVKVVPSIVSNDKIIFSYGIFLFLEKSISGLETRPVKSCFWVLTILSNNVFNSWAFLFMRCPPCKKMISNYKGRFSCIYK